MNQFVTWGPPRAERADAACNRRLLLVTAREIIAALLDDDERAFQEQVLAGPRHLALAPRRWTA